MAAHARPYFVAGGRKKMAAKKLKQTDPAPDSPGSYLRREYNAWQSLMAAQPALVQRFLEAQARKLAEAVTGRLPQARFTLPDRVVVSRSISAGTISAEWPDQDASPSGPAATVTVPPEQREQMIGGLLDRLSRGEVSDNLSQRLAELEASPNPAVATSAGLIRYTTAQHMVYSMLPSGRTVAYRAEENGEIPNLPLADELEPESAITAPTDAIVERQPGTDDEGRGELLVPYVEAARRFYLPQWVAFDEGDHLLVGSASEAEADIASMQRYVGILHGAVALAPYFVADETYQQKRYGILGQLVNQGRALARYITGEIIETIQRRAAADDLNRGLSLSLPYFDDQTLQMELHKFEVIPAGRIMFVPAFVVRAARQEQAKVAQDTRLDPSTRKHLLANLYRLEEAFSTGEQAIR
jgi:hypothetical protein